MAGKERKECTSCSRNRLIKFFYKQKRYYLRKKDGEFSTYIHYYPHCVDCQGKKVKTCLRKLSKRALNKLREYQKRYNKKWQRVHRTKV